METGVHAAGQLSSGNIILCGYSECFEFGKDGFSRIPMAESRTRTAAVVFQDSLFVAGGRYNYSITTSQTEFVSSHPDQSRLGKDLPSPVTDHCMVKINSTTAILVGGFPSRGHEETLFYSKEKDLWFPGPRLLKGTDYTSCGIIKDSTLTDHTIVVVGNECVISLFSSLIQDII